MLRLLRRCRVLALTLLLAAPGLGGTWLSLAHPCPVDMPWLAGAEQQGHAAQPSHGHGDAADGSSGSCSCVGICQGGAAALIAVQGSPALTAVEAGWTTAASTT